MADLPKHTCNLPNFGDKSKWVIDPAVPVYNGEPEQELQKLCQTNNRLAKQSCDLTAVTVGHTREDVPEWEQPPIIGYGINFRVVDFNGVPTIVADLAIEKDKWTTYRKFRRRSAELPPKSKMWKDGRIDPIAVGNFTPKRHLGERFSRESKDGKHIYPQQLPGGSVNPEEILNKLCAVLDEWKASKPAKEEAADTEAPMDVAPAVPPEAPQQYAEEDQPKLPLGDDGEAPQQNKMRCQRDEIEELRKEHKLMKDALNESVRRYQRAEREKVFISLANDGVQFDLKEELANVDDKDDKAFAKHVDTMKRRYARIPVNGKMIQPANINAEGGKPELTMDQVKELADAFSLGKISKADALLKINRK